MLFTFEFPERLNPADLAWSSDLDDVGGELELFVVRVGEVSGWVHVDVVTKVVIVERKLLERIRIDVLKTAMT